jgi:hypothetical protein
MMYWSPANAEGVDEQKENLTTKARRHEGGTKAPSLFLRVFVPSWLNSFLRAWDRVAKLRVPARHLLKKGKRFFFEKKKQKTFISLGAP